MFPFTYQERPAVQRFLHAHPCVTVVLPFEPLMSLKQSITKRLADLYEQAVQLMEDFYPLAQTEPVLKKLKKLFDQLDYSTCRKSIAVFVSPVIDKVYYLDCEVEEKITVGENFELKDLVHDKKNAQQYVLLSINERTSTSWFYDGVQLILMVSNDKDALYGTGNDYQDAFIRHADNGLSILLNVYALPLFVVGPAPVVTRFKELTHNGLQLAGCVYSVADPSSPAELLDALYVFAGQWDKIKTKYLLRKAMVAQLAGKLTAGLDNVQEALQRRRGKLLLLERQYAYPLSKAPAGPEEKAMPFYVKDCSDELVERMLLRGGEVAFVEKGALGEYQHIALLE